MGPRRWAAAVAAAALTATAVAHAASPRVSLAPGFKPRNAAAAQRIAVRNAAIDLVNRANDYVRHTRSVCKLTFPDQKSDTTHDAPSAPVLAALAPLRRPAIPGDALPARDVEHVGFGGTTYVDYTRTVTSASGRAFSIVVARALAFGLDVPAICVTAAHRRLRVLLRGTPPRVHAAALRQFASFAREAHRDAAKPKRPVDGIYLFGRAADGRITGGGGGGPIARFLTHGNFISFGGGRASHGHSTLNGIVPDGVATITFEYPRVVDRGRDFKPSVYASAITRTVAVHDNVVSLRVARGPGDAFAPRMVWRAADGHVLRVVKQPG